MVDTDERTAGGRGEAPGEDQDPAARAAALVRGVRDGVARGLAPDRAVAHHLPPDLDPATRGTVMVLLATGLAAALTSAWRRGWQPADVVHAARRDLHPGATEALVRGIREELGTYARTTVDPGWWEQVEGLQDLAGRRRARPRRTEGAPDDAHACVVACGDVVAATVLVERLPPLQLLGPVPGTAGPGGTQPAADVDDKLLTKVRRLLAQAEGTPYEAEAETFTAAAQSLMARHRIDRAMLEALEAAEGQGGPARGPGAVRLPLDRPYEQPKMLLLNVVAAANRCRALWDPSLGLATVVGHAADRRAVELLFTSLLVQATTALHREGEGTGPASRTRGFRSSFLQGFAARIGQRLQEASQAAEEQARAELDPAAGAGSAGPGPAGGDRMALVLQRRDEEVEDMVRQLFPHTVRTRARVVSDGAGWRQGRAAADRASLGLGGRLEGGAA